MLTSASDYTYNAANIASDSVDIQGRIIPTEDIADQPHPLRRENLAYLCEMISERLQNSNNPFWSVPARRAAVNKTDVSNIGAKIRDLYDTNATPSATRSQGFFPTNITASDFPIITDSTSGLLPRYDYASKLLKLTDCVVPAILPPQSPLSADYLRRCFYAMEFLRMREFSPDITKYGTMGGARHNEGYYSSKDGTTSINVTAPASSNFAPFYADDCGYCVNVDSPSGYAGFIGEGYGFLDPSGYGQHNEVWYDGTSCVSFGASDYSIEFDVKVLFARFSVRMYDLSTIGYTRKSIMYPITYTVATSSNGNTYLKVSVDKSFWQSVILLAFPNANLALSNSGRAYNVTMNPFISIADMKYKSRLPAAWTWTPSAASTPTPNN